MSDDESARITGISSRDQLSSKDQTHFDSINESRGGVRGPFRVLLQSPEVAGRTGHLGAYLRYESQLAGTDRELAILTVAREFDCAYEWAAHTPIARDEGVREAAIHVIATNDTTAGLTEAESTIVEYGRELFRETRITSDTYQAAADRFTDQQLIELTATMGYYALLACMLNAFEVYPDNDAPQLP